jgi:hypothetical protein
LFFARGVEEILIAMAVPGAKWPPYWSAQHDCAGRAFCVCCSTLRGLIGAIPRRKSHDREVTMKRLLAGLLLSIAASLLSLPAHAQASRVYEASAMVPTGIEGVRSFPESRQGFDPLRAFDIDLARYGLPPRPHEAESLARWQAAMSTRPRRSHEPIRKMAEYAGPALRRAAIASAVKDNTSPQSTSNWSGVVDFIRGLTTYDPAHSFSQVNAQFVVPFAQSAFVPAGGNVCTGQTMAVGWIGFDGWGSSDVLQGGWFAREGCSGGEQIPSEYCLWAEWYPMTPILCQMSANPGDVVFTQVWNTSASEGYVYVQDLTTNLFQTVALTCTLGGSPCLIGNTVEYIVERPDLPPVSLMNYVQNYIIGGSAETFDGTAYTPNGWSKAGAAWPIFHVSMIESDAGGVNETVSDYTQSGRRDLVFSAQGCALNGGC